MSTVKISELTALSSADAADELVIVDDSAGVTKKITHANLANFGTGTVTAGAIDFSGLANAAGMTSEVLDDYEEGTWTPTIQGTTTAGTASYPIQIGRYTKVGNFVSVFGRIGYNSLTGTGNLRITGLPFTTLNVANLFYTGSISYIDAISWTAGHYLSGLFIPSNDTIAEVTQTPTGGNSTIGVPVDAGGTIIFSASYLAS